MVVTMIVELTVPERTNLIDLMTKVNLVLASELTCLVEVKQASFEIEERGHKWNITKQP